jgi:hypothetical protein
MVAASTLDGLLDARGGWMVRWDSLGGWVLLTVLAGLESSQILLN